MLKLFKHVEEHGKITEAYINWRKFKKGIGLTLYNGRDRKVVIRLTVRPFKWACYWVMKEGT